jgi:hypothetical protein
MDAQRAGMAKIRLWRKEIGEIRPNHGPNVNLRRRAPADLLRNEHTAEGIRFLAA